MEHRIQYLRDQRGNPVGCVAIKIKAVDEVGFFAFPKTLITYQVSVLNPADNFNRPLARQLALGRLVEAPLTTTTRYGARMNEITEAIMSDIASDSIAPSRARKAAKLWLRTNEESLRSDTYI